MPQTGLPLEVDLAGRVHNMRLAPSNGIHALYEAIVNSLHSVLDTPDPSKGTIQITIVRGSGQLPLLDKKRVAPITGFAISDSGIGFDDDNYRSFRQSDTRTKAKYGGHGVGRFFWLKVFNSVRIASIYTEGTKRLERTFTFSLDGIVETSHTTTPSAAQTIVTLENANSRYSDGLQHDPDTLADAIIEHCLEFFVAPKPSRVFLIDPATNYKSDLVARFRDELRSPIKRDRFDVNSQTFTITHVLVKGRKNSRHAIHFCANSRRVEDETVTGKIPGLGVGLRLPTSDEDLSYQGYVSGDLLDNYVNAERTSFDFDDLQILNATTPPEGRVTVDALREAAREKAAGFLQPILEPLLAVHTQRIENVVQDSLPHYRWLVKHRPGDIASIPLGANGADLDLALYKIEQRVDAENREAIGKAIGDPRDPDEPAESRRQRLEVLLQQLTDSGMAKLARHVAYRRAVIEFLEDQMRLSTDGKYSLEEVIHNAVCPQRVTSEDVPPSQLNLWLLDDRFYYHHYLASDMRIKDLKETIKRDSEDRPDLAIFHRPMAFTDSLERIGAVVLVEFKRPQRKDYSSDDEKRNPISQVLGYIKTLTSGDAVGAKGQAIYVHNNTPFYVYIVADLTKSLRDLAAEYDFVLAPDGEGFFKFFQNHNCYMEIISFTKMIADAKKRNQAFFDKLNIPLQ